MAEQVGDKLSELNLSSDEMDRLTQAFRDEKFKKMLCDYAQELSDPANREKYEQEIKQFEQERGNSIEFIHPEPCRVIRTSAGGEDCFINICSSEKIDRPVFKPAVSKDGRRGQSLSLPYSLFPGRQNTDPKGNKYVIYDVIFHPDTLHMAAKDKNFNDMVNNTAIDEIQKAFKVILDKNKVREMKSKYKGSPQPCVIRTPVPGYEAKETPEQPDPLAFPYPDESDSSFQTAREPAEPSYTVKYRSVVDLQDYRCSSDSAPSPRPKEVVIVIDLPLLKSVGDTSLEVKGKTLQLESKRPAYRLELPLAYPVDEDNGEAKFDKQRRQLTITLPVLPPQEASLCLDPGRWEEERREVETQESTIGKVVKEELVAKQSRDHEKTQRDCCFLDDNPVLKTNFSAEEETTADDNRFEASSETEFPHIFTSAKHLSFPEDDRETKETSTQSASQETTEIIQADIRDDNVSEGGPESSHEFVTNVPSVSTRRDLSVDFLKEKKKIAGEGDPLAEQVLQTPEPDEMPAAATALREIDADGNETVISDHSTSAGFIFQNKLMYELD